MVRETSYTALARVKRGLEPRSEARKRSASAIAKGCLPCLEDGVFSVLSIMGMLHVPGKPVCVSSPLAPSPPTALRAGGVTRSRSAPSNSTTWSCPSLTITRNNLCSKPHDDANAMQSCRAISHQLGDVLSSNLLACLREERAAPYIINDAISSSLNLTPGTFSLFYLLTFSSFCFLTFIHPRRSSSAN